VGLALAKDQPHHTPSNLPILTHVGQVCQLTRGQAALGRPVRLRGVVTCYDPQWLVLFVQDSTGGIYVYSKSVTVNLRPGQRLDVEGLPGLGKLTAAVFKARVRVLGSAPLPAPRGVSIHDLSPAQEDSLWVETPAVLRSASQEGGQYLQFNLASAEGRLTAVLPNVREVNPSRLVDATVRVRGLGGGEFDAKEQFVGALLYVPSLAFGEGQAPPPPEPFALPARSISSLAQLPLGPAFVHRVRVRGVVTLLRMGQRLFTKDETGSLLIETRQTIPLPPGDRLEVVGFPDLGHHKLILQDAIFRQIGETAPPPSGGGSSSSDPEPIPDRVGGHCMPVRSLIPFSSERKGHCSNSSNRILKCPKILQASAKGLWSPSFSWLSSPKLNPSQGLSSQEFQDRLD
jgi:hypothetical protein